MTIDGNIFLEVFIGILAGHILIEVGKYIFHIWRARREQKRFQKEVDEAWRETEEDKHKKED